MVHPVEIIFALHKLERFPPHWHEAWIISFGIWLFIVMFIEALKEPPLPPPPAEDEDE